MSLGCKLKSSLSDTRQEDNTVQDMKTRKFRIVIFNEDLETKFESPVFDQAKGTYNPKLIGEDQRDKSEALDQPLLPTTKEGRNRIIIR